MNDNVRTLPSNSKNGETPLAERLVEKFLRLGQEMAEGGVNQDFVIGAILTAAVSAITNCCGTNDAVRWLREIADEIEAGSH